MSLGQGQKPHAVCIPFPTQGHINPMLQLAKLLHSQGFHITFVHTDFNYNRILRSKGPAALTGLPAFKFESISDGMPSTKDDNATRDIPSLCISTEYGSCEPFKELINRLNESGDVPQVSCIVADVAMYFTLDVAEELGIPEVLQYTASACGFLAYSLFPKLVHLGITPFKDDNFLTNGDLEVILEWIPCSMEQIQVKDIPTFIRTTDPNDIMLNRLIREISSTKRASAILFNSFQALESKVLQSLRPDFPPLYTIGPMHLLHDSVDEETNSIRPSTLWKEDETCLEWLDSNVSNSVVYVNFGSVAIMSNDQMVEFAWGLADCNQPFLWITRPNLVADRDSVVLPPGFLEETKGRGLITGWCNQEQVLNHPAVGLFLTHCGWNSTLESITSGVPMICWPFFAEQQTNSWFCSNKWGVGVRIEGSVKRDKVEKHIREMLEVENGNEMKKKAMEWKKSANEAVSAPNGTSYCNLQKVIKMLKSFEV